MIEPMPGRAATSPPTTRRSDGTIETSRSTRRMRSARSTDRLPVAGISAMATTTRSKMRQGSRRKAVR